LGRGARAVAWAPDGIVEAIEVSGASAPCIGVQWELQESWQSDERFLQVFRSLLAGG
jgi:gamma-glutamyl-gamma-aminobutyrate hydrolase PuuD